MVERGIFLHKNSAIQVDSPLADSTLSMYLAYRVVLGLLITTLSLTHTGPAMLGALDPGLFAIAAQVFLALAVFSLIINYLKLIPRDTQVLLAVLIDIVATTVILHTSGGVQSGLGLLIAVSIAMASLSTGGRIALLSAAMGTLALMADHLYAHSSGQLQQTAYTHVGLLGAAFFALAGLAHQLSARVHISEQLARQRGMDLANLAELNEYVIQHMQTGILVVDRRLQVRLMNEAAWYQLGMPDAGSGQPLRAACAPLQTHLVNWLRHGSAPPTFRAVSDGRDLQAQFTRLGEAGNLGVLIFLEDTSAVVERAQQLKLASLGRLTASIAHEIRNPLGSISHAAQLLQESDSLDGTDRRMADIVEQNAKRVNEVIENVLRLSRRESPHPRPIALDDWLGDLVKSFLEAHQLPARQLQIDVDPPGTTVQADPTQMTQIITTLLNNAVDHFQGPRDQLRLRIAAGITAQSGGPYIEVIDNGPGIPTEVAAKIFEPFFTTRNDGTGLGLYIAKELSEANKIRLEYLAVPTGGAGFRLSFPDPRRRNP
jgi:two-component system sensor histidine kinase PilS (NtrC family)